MRRIKYNFDNEPNWENINLESSAQLKEEDGDLQGAIQDYSLAITNDPRDYFLMFETGKNCTHPGYEERRNNLIDFIFKNYPDFSDVKRHTKGSWKYDRKENTLTYKIKESCSPPKEKNLKAATKLAKAFEGEVIKN